ncbi:MAG TPA: MlaD family protein [Spirochaetota bacterium]|nr:MlaD family protein [Spirochaetota bacterium]HPJ37034.1 MlaD family protein [Spirochaetota bacterium]
MKLEKNELRVAIFILIPAALLLIFVLLKLGYSVASSTTDIYLKVDNISSIKKGTLVKIKGYTVGRVVEIIPVYKPALHFLAVMRLQREIQLYENCTAVIQNQNIIGDPVIELKNPERIGIALGDGAVIEGIELVNLEVVLQDIHVLLNTLSGTASVIREISAESKGNLRNLLGNLSSTAATFSSMMNSSQQDIVETLKTFKKTAQTMNEISVELKKHPVKFLFK